MGDEIMNFKINSFILIFLLLIIGIGAVSASEVNDDNITLSENISSVPNDDLYQCDVLSIDSDDFQKEDDGNYQNDELKSSDFQEELEDTGSEVIVVENWDELQYYCSLKDNDYTLKLKENTSFYPTNPSDSNYQIKVYNNVKIIGSEGSYIGYESSNAPLIKYTAIVVPDNYKSSICMENVNFKWISVDYGSDGIFLQMGGKRNNFFKNCNFNNIITNVGHSCIVYLKRGTVTLDNCSFINCTTDFGVLSVYDPGSVKTTDMIVRNCYFEGNYAKTEPGCINNCGKLTVYNSTFVKNRSFWWAGAIHTHSDANTTIYDSNFMDNVAGWNGGALYTYSYLQIYNTVFVGNNCTTNSGGGAIGACSYQSNPHIYIENCLFENNANNCWRADELSDGAGSGGAIAIMDSGSFVVLNTSFVHNSAAYGCAISASASAEYGSPSVIIANNSFINHTSSETLRIYVSGSIAILEGNYFEGNYIIFKDLILNSVSSGKDYATLKIDVNLSNPQYYDSDILNKMEYQVYVNDEYVKTVNSRIFTIDFEDFDICDVYVVPTISNIKSNEVSVYCLRDYIYVSKAEGNDSFDGLSRNTPVNTIERALELANGCQSILIMDGNYSEENLQIDYDLLIKGEGNATLTNSTSFMVNAGNFTLKNIKIDSIIGESFIRQVNGNLIVDKCIFNNNAASKLIDADKVNITKSIFTNNNLVVYNGGFTTIKNSILLNNTQIIDNNLDSIDLDYNWWGNILNNISKPSDLNINNWLVLNATTSKNALENAQSSTVQFGMYLFENNKVTKYNDLIKFNLATNALNASVNKNAIVYNGKIIYTQTSLVDSVLTASYNDVLINVPFKFLKSSPNLSIIFSNIMYNEDLTIKVSAPNDIGGDISVTVGSKSNTKPLTNGVTFTFKYLEAGDYNITVNYGGNGKYQSQVIKSSVQVKKYDSTTQIRIGSVNVGEDIEITVTTSTGTTGNVNLTINDIVGEIITLKNREAKYIFKNVARGDYLITAYYMGDDRNLPSQSSYFLEVDNINPDLTASIADSNYGEAAIIDVRVNDGANGYVTASIDDITNSSEVINGHSRIYLYGADAGINREVTIFYSGDDTYFNRTITTNMTVFKNNFTFNISSEDIYIGHDAVIMIKVPLKTKGNFTINSVVLSIPMSGEVSYTIPDLEVGNYTITAIYNGNNYFTVENSTSFTVFEYPSPQWMNDGVDTQNSQKTDHVSSSTGFVAWTDQINSTVIANIVVDSEGNLYLATVNGIYSYDGEGSLRWIYHSDGRIGNFSGLAIGRDVIISPRAGDTIYLIRNNLDLVNQTTGEKYGSSNIYQASSIFVPVIDANANIYTVSEYQFEGQGYNLVITPFKIWENGGHPTQISLGNVKPIAAPTVNSDMFVVLGEGNLMIFDAKTGLSNSIKTGNFKNVRPVIGDGNIVYTILGNSIIAYTIDGSQSGSKIPITGGAGDKLLINNELNLLYATNGDGSLYSYDLFTREETLIFDSKITSGILIDGNNNLLFGCDNLFYCIDSNGKVLWKSDLGSKIIGTPIINKDGVIYVTSEDNKLFALSHLSLDDSGLEVSATNASEGEDVVITIKINNQTTGNVSFKLNGVVYSFETGNGTIVKAISDLPAGTYTVNVTYPGDLKFDKASQVVTFTVEAKSVPVTPDEPVVLNTIIKGSDITVLYTSNSYYKVKLTQNNAPLAGKTIIINFNGANYKINTDKNGIATFKITAKPGKYTIKATYNNKATKNTVTVKSILQAKNLKVKKSAKTAKIKVTLKKVNNKYLKGKTLKLKINKKTLKAKTNKKGVATFKLSKSILKKLKKAKKYTYTVTYLKDSIKKSLMVK